VCGFICAHSAGARLVMLFEIIDIAAACVQRGGRCGNDVVIADDRSCAIEFEGKPKPRAKGQRVATDWTASSVPDPDCQVLQHRD
jgi:hypothetical protein